jgi:transposase
VSSQTPERRPCRSNSHGVQGGRGRACPHERQDDAAIARKMGLGEKAVREWVRQAGVDAGRRDGLTPSEREELSRLRRENRLLREEATS